MKSNEQKKAKIAYDKAIIHYQSVQLDEYGGEFSFSDLNIYLELFMSMQEWSDGLKAVKSVARWLCGRKSETFWDLRDDDCEWDLEHEPRRTALPNFDSSAHKLDAYGQALLPEIRAKMGIFRLHLGRTQLEEAMRHFELFYPDDEGDEATVFEYSDLFREIAEALRGERHYKEALRFYEPLQRVQKVLEVSITKNMAECYSKTFNFERAIVCWGGVLQTDDSNVDVLMELAKAYEASGDSAKAYKHLAHLMRLGRRDVIQRSGLNIQPVVADRYATQSMPLLLPKPSSTAAADDAGQAGATIEEAQGTEHIVLVDQRKTRPYKMRKPGGESTRQRVRHQARYLLTLYDESEELKPAMRAGDESAEQQWMDAAQILTDALREEKLFFPADRYIKFLGYSTEARRRAIHPRERNELLEMADRLQTNLGTNKDTDDNDFGNLNPVDETQFSQPPTTASNSQPGSTSPANTPSASPCTPKPPNATPSSNPSPTATSSTTPSPPCNTSTSASYAPRSSSTTKNASATPPASSSKPPPTSQTPSAYTPLSTASSPPHHPGTTAAPPRNS